MFAAFDPVLTLRLLLLRQRARAASHSISSDASRDTDRVNSVYAAVSMHLQVVPTATTTMRLNQIAAHYCLCQCLLQSP